MFFRTKEDLQRLNLEAPKPGATPPSAATLATQSIPLYNIDPARLEAVNHRAKESWTQVEYRNGCLFAGLPMACLCFNPPATRSR